MLCFLQQGDDETKRDAFSHEWTNYPSSLFKPDPCTPDKFVMVKGNKSDFLAGILQEVDATVLHDILPYLLSRQSCSLMQWHLSSVIKIWEHRHLEIW